MNTPDPKTALSPNPSAAAPTDLIRWRLDISYAGADFHGWAAQPGLRTVQGLLEDWIPKVLRLGHPTPLTCSGRTDAGVHARGQVAHVDLPATAATDTLARRLRRVLPSDLVVRAITPAPPGFDARFSAIWRRYRYRLDDSGAPDPLHRGIVVPTAPLDVEAMNTAAAALLGLRDFAAFCKRREGATTIRNLLEARVERMPQAPGHPESAGRVDCTLVADAFCHSMVRSVVGALVAVGTGARDLDWLLRVADESSRSSEVQVMAAHGLCLEEVGFPGDAELARRAQQSRARRDEEPR